MKKQFIPQKIVIAVLLCIFIPMIFAYAQTSDGLTGTPPSSTTPQNTTSGQSITPVSRATSSTTQPRQNTVLVPKIQQNTMEILPTTSNTQSSATNQNLDNTLLFGGIALAVILAIGGFLGFKFLKKKPQNTKTKEKLDFKPKEEE